MIATTRRAVQLSLILLATTPAWGADGLVAAYGFNEGSGTTAADASGNLLTGTLTGATWSTNGRYGGAISFDGAGDWVTVNSSTLLNLSTGMTVQAWVYPTALSGWRTVVLKERPTGFAYALYAHDNAPRPAAYIRVGAGDVAAIGTGQLPLNTWTHLATTYDGTTLRLYVNGTLVRSQGVSGAMVASSSPLRIGGNAVWGEYFTGRIDEVRIHNRALTQAEIQAFLLVPVEEHPGFGIIVYNDPVAVGLSDSGIFNLGIAPSGGFTSWVFPLVSGLPPDTTAVFEPADGPPHPGPFALTVTTGPATPPGTYTLSVTCTNGTLSATTNLTLIVHGGAGFRVSVEPNDLILAQGQSGVATVQVDSENGYSQPVTLSAAGLPSGTSATFTPPGLTPPGSATVRFQPVALTPPGIYPVVLRATDGSLTNQATFTLTVQPQQSSGSWRQLSLGDPGVMYYGCIVGDIGGVKRVIGSAGDGLMYEYLYNGSSWSFLKMPVGVFADGEMHNMGIGPARGDGTNRLYIAAAGSGRVYEMSWVNGAWQSNLVATLNGSTDIIIGNGRNDGVIRMYVTWKNGTTEFTWNGTGWTQVTMSNNEGINDGGWVHGIDMERGRNDGINRIYTANQGNGEVYEYTWNGSIWIKTIIGDVGDARNVEVGQGRNDGVFRVYVASGDANVYEFTWSGSAWGQGVAMGTGGSSAIKVQCVPVRARDDNLVRIYASAGSGVYEYNWTGTAWEGARLGSAVAYMYGLSAGDALNSGRPQVYAASYDGNVYMFEWVPTAVNHAPVATNLNLTMLEDTGTNLMLLGSDVDGPVMYAILTAPTNGVLGVLNTNSGAVAYTPNTNFFGIDTFRFTVSDGSLQATGTVSLTITAVNDAPTLALASNNVVVLEDSGAVTVTSFASTTVGPANELAQSITNIVVLSVSNATLFAAGPAISTGGTLTFTPAANSNGVAAVTVQARDNGGTANGGTNGSGGQTFTITVTAVNDAPVANDDNYDLGDGVALDIPAPGVLTNDSDAEGDSLTAILVSGPLQGALNLNSAGGFNYTPTNYFNGVDTFTYQASDGQTNSGPATVSIIVSNKIQISSIVLSNNLVTVTWTSIVGKSYRLQFKESLTDASWTDLPPDVVATGTTAIGTNAVDTGTQRFYQVKWLGN